MNDVRAMLIESATRLFAEQVNAKVLDGAKEDGWSEALWSIVEEAQLPYVSIAEDAGGAGGGGGRGVGGGRGPGDSGEAAGGV